MGKSQGEVNILRERGHGLSGRSSDLTLEEARDLKQKWPLSTLKEGKPVVNGPQKILNGAEDLE